nr:hypothetical protein [Tanacetum cinerariifolium]
MKCYNCQGEGNMARQCIQQKRPWNATWFKEKLMLAKPQEASQILDKEQLAFLADLGISEAPDVQEMQYSKQTYIDDFKDNEIHSDSNIILYSQYFVITKEHDVISVTDDEETLILEEESRSKMLDKQNDPISIENKIKISPIDYSKLNKIKEDFVNSVDSFDVKNSCVSDCNKCLELETELPTKKDFIEIYDNFREKQNAPTFNQLFELNELEAQSQEKDTIIKKLKDRIKYLSGKDAMENVKKDIDKIETINIELEHSVSLENSNLNAQLQEKVFAITTLKNELRKLKGKNVVDTTVYKPNATIAPEMFKLNIKPISHRIKHNRVAHETFPISPKPSEKLVAVTPMNKDKRVRFAKSVTSSSNIPKQTDSLKTKDSNKPFLTSTGVKPTTSASESNPSGNTKNNRIS